MDKSFILSITPVISLQPSHQSATRLGLVCLSPPKQLQVPNTSLLFLQQRHLQFKSKSDASFLQISLPYSGIFRRFRQNIGYYFLSFSGGQCLANRKCLASRMPRSNFSAGLGVGRQIIRCKGRAKKLMEKIRAQSARPFL